jgi:hypothetical protein
MSKVIKTTTGTWTCPAGVTSAVIECWGAGGGAQYYGGGGGGYSKKTVTVIPTTVYDVVVGVGGGPDADGGDSYFNDISTVLAKGGKKGSTKTGGQSSEGVGDIKYSGGDGGDSLNPFGGGGGGGAGTTEDGGDGGDSGGASGGLAGIGGDLYGGDGGVGGRYSGNNGSSYGGGGGATFESGTQGSGANGVVIITYIDVTILDTVTATDLEFTRITFTIKDTVTATDTVTANDLSQRDRWKTQPKSTGTNWTAQDKS